MIKDKGRKDKDTKSLEVKATRKLNELMLSIMIFDLKFEICRLLKIKLFGMTQHNIHKIPNIFALYLLTVLF